MLPLQQAHEVRASVIEYIKATFRFKEKAVGDAFYRFVEDKEDGLFKGPYVSLKTPFVSATEEEAARLPLDIAPDFPPYLHQLQAFAQLTTRDGHQPRPTLLTTGTGSGKTECFLYPVLDYCWRQNRYGRRPGVKVIVMYPMNALASDQAKRIAQAIWEDERLRGRVTAGLFVGEGVDAKDYPRTMGEDHIIENRDAILDAAPDILLTNFKMLDYGLMRQRFAPLWRGNADTEEKALRFIVVDELHTYDGAQGTDVANLVRRLKLKLSLPQGQLCPIGTSATMGSGAESKARLCAYAEDVFGERFDESCVIEERRVPASEYVTPVQSGLPDGKRLRTCAFGPGDTVETYMRRLCSVWLGAGSISPVEAGERLREMGIVGSLLDVLSAGTLSLDDIKKRLIDTDAAFRRLFLKDGERVSLLAIESLLALAAYAKRPLRYSDRLTPMLHLQVQLWQRELSGVLRYVQKEPEFVWRHSLRKDEERVALPMYFCRECGASGWITRKLETEGFSADVRAVNKDFMTREKEVRLLNIENSSHQPIGEYLNETAGTEVCHVSTKDLRKTGPAEEGSLRVRVCTRTTATDNGRQHFAACCPECAGDTLCQVGHRASTLSSVAVSQVLSSDFDHADERERRVLVFANSVQDAAHDAAYYEARTFRFLFRQSMQKYIKKLDEPVTLTQLQEGFKRYWKGRLTEEEYYGRFLPADLATHIDLRKNYREGNGFMDRFKEEFDTRVDWEIASELGLTSQLGRTLEKTGASATFFKSEDIRQVYAEMAEWLRANNMERADDEQTFCHYVYGVLQRMRRHGAVDHPYLEKFRNEALTYWALNWRRDGRHFLNRLFGRGVSFPRLPGTEWEDRTGGMLDTAVLKKARGNWYSDFFWRTFGFRLEENVTLFNDFVRELFATMERTGLVNSAPQGGANYAICPDRLWVSKSVKHIKCDKCQSTLYVARRDEWSEDTRCLNYKCQGCYSEEVEPEFDYYQQVYNRHISPRVHAHEHTGLLERAERERLEHDFKDHPRSDSVNVLAATSTLEMGIDIGDLNVVGNANIAPKPSSFIQRTGRAGRKEGSALVLNYARQSEPHDMYYFTYPSEMMEGEVGTPGCFLQAKDILRRHFLAYCIDTWVGESRDHSVPSKVRELHLTEDALSSPDFAINRIISFIKANKRTLTARFAAAYDERTQPTLAQLAATLDDETFFQNVLKAFRTLSDRLYALADELQGYKRQESKLQANDPARESLKNLIRVCKKQYATLMDESVIEHMTNSGLLPNYAFPETGVKLEASVYSSREKEDRKDNVAEPRLIELTRPATQGIRELAPGSKFCTQKMQLEVSGIPTFDWKDTLVTMRYCSKCDCIAEEGTAEYAMAACPKCGDPSWGVNTHRYLRYTTARSAMNKTEAALGDATEEREREQYVVRKHFMFRHHGAVSAYAMRGTGFGIEYCNSMDLYEANYGMPMQTGAKVEVGGETQAPENGFVTCRHCGKATPLLGKQTRDRKPVEQHYRFCTHKDTAFADDPKGDVFERLYLYRHMRTEAIKILLPVQIMDAKAAVEMFKAGLELGMKEYYHSSPDHIRIDSYEENNRATGKMDYYLVMYDTIPGGTGYLAKLYDTEQFSRLIELAYERIKGCTCQLEGKDGCYHCIMTYGNQYSRENFSREQAEQLFAKLAGGAKTWERLAGSVGTVAHDGAAEDSELELKFVRALQTLAAQGGWTFEKKPDDTSYYYRLHIEDAEMGTELTYHVKPQFELTVAYGVRKVTIPDFQIMCAYARIDGKEIEDKAEIPWFAIYLDGYAYHAAAPNMRFYTDLEKREGIREARPQRMYSWTLTWDDIQLFEQGGDDEIGGNSVSRLGELLLNPQMGAIKEICFGAIYEMDYFLGSGGSLYKGYVKTDDSCGEYEDFASDEEADRAYTAALTYDLEITKGLQAADKDEWVGFWRRYDLLQFFSPAKAQEADGATAEKTDADREEIKALYPGLEDIVDLLIDHGVPFSHEGLCELTNEDNEVVACAGLLTDCPLLAIDPATDEDRRVFEERGYKVVTSETFNVGLITQ